MTPSSHLSCPNHTLRTPPSRSHTSTVIIPLPSRTLITLSSHPHHTLITPSSHPHHTPTHTQGIFYLNQALLHDDVIHRRNESGVDLLHALYNKPPFVTDRRERGRIQIWFS